MKKAPDAWANMSGSAQYPDVRGTVRFYQTVYGALVIAEIRGLPQGNTICERPIFAFHIHDGETCKTHNGMNPNPNGSMNPTPNGSMNSNPNGSMNQNPNGNMSQNPNGNMSQNPNGNMSQNPNGSMNSNPNGSMNSNPNGSMNQNPNGSMSQNPNGNGEPFPMSGTHYNPHNCPHPYHAGDMPPLFGTNGYAFLSFITSRFKVNEIIGKTVIIHSSPDDFTTQPSGNSGTKIACGVIIGKKPF